MLSATGRSTASTDDEGRIQWAPWNGYGLMTDYHCHTQLLAGWLLR
jgi:hypothetical protein